MKTFLFICFIIPVISFAWPDYVKADEDIITVFVPSVPGIEKLISENSPDSKKKTGKIIWKNEDIPEADILMSLMKPDSYLPYAMDMPQSFAMIFYGDSGGEEPVRKDLLGDIEEIRYLDQRAWGANVALAEPGLYQFLLEGKPFWDEKKDKYFQQNVKLYLPVLSDGAGWDNTVTRGLEIIPLTRPYGLMAPAFFSARVVNDGKDVSGARVKAGRINIGKKSAPSRWHNYLETRTSQEGVFSFVLNQAGWWYCEAIIQGEPLKGTDGKMKELKKSAVIWVYVEGNS